MQEFIVSTLEDENDGNHDAGDLSLREAIALANEQEGADTITFDSNLSGGTIALTQTVPTPRGGGEFNESFDIKDSVNIVGLGADKLTIDGLSSGNGIFNIGGEYPNTEDPNLNVSLEGLTITNGFDARFFFMDAGVGGAIKFSGNNLTVKDSAITNSKADIGGAISSSGHVNIIDSTISNNDNGGFGGSFPSGAIDANSLDITNSTISNNPNSAIFADTLNISNSTVTNNDEGISSYGTSSVKITSSIVADNNNIDLFTFKTGDGSPVITSGGNNLIGDRGKLESFTDGVNGDIVGTTDNPVDPNLGELQDNGGATPTQELLAGSPAIDAGSNPDGLATDQRGEGFDRTVGNGTDIGAFEVQDGGGGTIPDELVVSTLEDESDGDFSEGDLSLREAIALANEQEGEDTITFDSSLSDGTIALTQSVAAPNGGDGSELNQDLGITDSLNIVGLGANNLTIDGLSRGNGIFDIRGENTNVNLEGLTIANGYHARFFRNFTLTGGAINVEGANLTLKDSLIIGSNATLAGAINNSGNASIINSTITDSSGIDDSVPGGVIYNTGTLDISNSSINGNRSRGIANSGTLEVNNSNVSDNFGGGVFNSNSATVTSSIIANNTSSDVTFTTVTPGSNTDDDVVGTEAFTSGGNNLIGRVDAFGSFAFDSGNAAGFVDGENGDIVGIADNPINPQLGELKDNGGATQTQELLPGSPAIDAGSNPNGLATDQRGEGFGRTVGNGTDIGAFEVQDGGGGSIPSELVVSTLEDESDGDFSEGDLSLREAIALANEQEGEDTITFDSSLSSGTIDFAESQERNLAINDSVSIKGLGQDNLTLDGGFIFNIAADTDVAVDGLNLTGGKIDSFGNLTLTNSTISETIALDGSSDNSPITSRGTTIINNSTIRDNSGGGKVGILVESGTAAISNSTVANNEAVLGRAGILIDSDATVDISNSTVANNQSRSNGGIENSGTVEITNSTIANNTGGLAAGGLINFEDSKATVTSSIIANSNLGSIPIGDVSGDGEFISGGNNLISNGDDATGFIESDIVGTDAQPIDPNLGELQNNGGSTPTQELLAGSPAIDAGSNPDNLTTDQRGEGFDRTVGDGTDIGAFEVQNIDTNPGGGGGKPHPSTMPTSGDDTLLGTPCNDNIDGLEGNDILIGCNGNDTLSGGLGHDSLQGDDGRDTFVLASGFGTDTIVDFDCGNDLIGLSSEISFADLSFSGNNIILGTETIATLNGFDTANLTESNFVEV
jgi:CSLREA domain-containing protein